MKTIFIALMVSMCMSQFSSSEDVFKHPEKFVGKNVRVCGYVTSLSTVRPSRKSGIGINIVDPDGKIRVKRAKQCLFGKIVFSGCESGKYVCLEWQYEYGILINDGIE